MNNLVYLLAVFGIVWVVIFIYVLSLINREKKLSKDIQSLKDLLKQKGL